MTKVSYLVSSVLSSLWSYLLSSWYVDAHGGITGVPRLHGHARRVERHTRHPQRTRKCTLMCWKRRCTSTVCCCIRRRCSVLEEEVNLISCDPSLLETSVCRPDHTVFRNSDNCVPKKKEFQPPTLYYLFRSYNKRNHLYYRYIIEEMNECVRSLW